MVNNPIFNPNMYSKLSNDNNGYYNVGTNGISYNTEGRIAEKSFVRNTSLKAVYIAINKIDFNDLKKELADKTSSQLNCLSTRTKIIEAKLEKSGSKYAWYERIAIAILNLVLPLLKFEKIDVTPYDLTQVMKLNNLINEIAVNKLADESINDLQNIVQKSKQKEKDALEERVRKSKEEIIEDMRKNREAAKAKPVLLDDAADLEEQMRKAKETAAEQTRKANEASKALADAQRQKEVEALAEIARNIEDAITEQMREVKESKNVITELKRQAQAYEEQMRQEGEAAAKEQDTAYAGLVEIVEEEVQHGRNDTSTHQVALDPDKSTFEKVIKIKAHEHEGKIPGDLTNTDREFDPACQEAMHMARIINPNIHKAHERKREPKD